MRSKPKQHFNLEEWHTWFAWYPVCIDLDKGRFQWVWLENVTRKECFVSEIGPWWVYRPEKEGGR